MLTFYLSNALSYASPSCHNQSMPVTSIKEKMKYDYLHSRKINFSMQQVIFHLHVMQHARNRASDISRGCGPAKFWYFRKIPRNSQKNAKYREIRQKYFQIHVGKTYLILILAIKPVLFTPNVQIQLETSSLQRVNNVPKLPGVLDERCEKLGTNHNVNIRSFLERTDVERANDYPSVNKNVHKRWSYRRKIDRFQRNLPKKTPAKSAVFY